MMGRNPAGFPAFLFRRIMKKGQIIEGTVKEISFPNVGLVETEDGQESLPRGGEAA